RVLYIIQVCYIFEFYLYFLLSYFSKEKLKVRVQKWKASLETKGLRVNVGKTKVMVGGEGPRRVEETGKWPCGVCRKGVGRNSLQCTNCLKWVHKRCSQVKGKLATASLTFICAKCTGQVADCVKGDERFDIGNGDSLEKVERFCYLGDMVSADGGADSAVTARVRSTWKKFKELAPILTSKGASLWLKGKIYQSCVRSCMMYGSETWAMKKEHVEKLVRTEMRMIRWMCGAKLSDRRASAELREQVGVEAVSDVLRRNRLRWFGHVERKAHDDWVKKCTVMEVEGKRPKGRPRKTWMEVVRNDMKQMHLVSTDAQDRQKWRKGIWSRPMA
ncbi:hypothetical protein JGG67_22900, partial [Salmonella enterica subsp. enterica serovar Derby]|nr:hypothetical protein [Salmonella enterica subsp. enterica serovar Derby]